MEYTRIIKDHSIFEFTRTSFLEFHFLKVFIQNLFDQTSIFLLHQNFLQERILFLILKFLYLLQIAISLIHDNLLVNYQ